MKTKREHRNTNARVAQRRPIECRFAKPTRFAVAVCPAALDAPIGDDDSSRLADVVADENAERTGRSPDMEDSFDLLKEVLPKLPPRECAMLHLSFSLESSVEKTLQELGALMRLTRERTRQLQNPQFNRLRRRMEERDSLPMKRLTERGCAGSQSQLSRTCCGWSATQPRSGSGARFANAPSWILSITA